MTETYRVTSFGADSDLPPLQAELSITDVPKDLMDEMLRIDVSGPTHIGTIALPLFVLTQLMARVMAVKEQRAKIIMPPKPGIVLQ